MEFLACVNPRYFAGIELFAAKNGVRYYLQGVYIEPHHEKGAVIVASDGHRLAAIHDPDGMCKEPIIVGEITKGLISACKSKGSAKRMTVPGKLWIGNGGAILTHSLASEHAPDDSFDPAVLHASKIRLLDGKFPDWRQVVGKLSAAEGKPIPVLNAGYVASVSDALRIMDPTDKAPVVRLYGNGTECAAVARCGNLDIGERFVALIMPLRHDSFPKAVLPGWMAPKAKPRLKYRGSELVTA